MSTDQKRADVLMQLRAYSAQGQLAWRFDHRAAAPAHKDRFTITPPGGVPLELSTHEAWVWLGGFTAGLRERAGGEPTPPAHGEIWKLRWSGTDREVVGQWDAGYLPGGAWWLPGDDRAVGPGEVEPLRRLAKVGP